MQKGKVSRLICLRARVGLYVCVGCFEHFFGTSDGQTLDCVDVSNSCVITLTWVTLDRSEGHKRIQRFTTRDTQVIFRSNQLYLRLPTLLFQIN
ncbi:hypothetical protein KL86PLE_41234 [uncultured Pleomorphomonas sp.]|uniref:Uncharacterized protein n=1 Tax=uncultured Pleomorphomonas sp. TaxID=442121 RepID=A0A212LJ90_9HYPH|nr:hypothetical protein KL86PLE_41234 [uncultured Pleomorphomonas sp.]